MATRKRTTEAAVPPQDALDAFVARSQKDPRHAMALMLWQNRFNQPDMYVQIRERDLDAFEQSMRYQKVKPTVIVHREPGTPAAPARPATQGSRAIPASPGTPAKPYVVVLMVETDKLGNPTMNAVKAIENNEDDFDRAQTAQQLQRWRDKAPALAQALLVAAQKGEYSSSDLTDAANALLALATPTQ